MARLSEQRGIAMNKIKSRRGYSLSEVIIALAIIVIVSITAISIIMSSIMTKSRIINRAAAQSFADNVWECFKSSRNIVEFEKNVIFAEGVTLDINNGEECQYRSDKNKFTAIIMVDFNRERPKLSIMIEDDEGEDLVSFSYEKGGV